MKIQKNFSIGIVCLLFSFTEIKNNFITPPFLSPFTNYLIDNPINYDGLFYTYQTKILGVQGNLLPLMNFTAAGFFNNNVNSPNFNKFFQVDSVFINDAPLFFNSGGYVDTTFTAFTGPFSWRVAGGNLFPSFTYINSNQLPTYSGYNLLPDTILSTQDVSITINNYNNADSVQVTLKNSDNGHQTIKKNINSSGVVTFLLSSDLAGIYSQNSQLSIWVNFTNFNPQTILGKQIQFVNSYTLVKSVVLVNNNSNRIRK